MSSLRAVNGEVNAPPRAGRCVVLADPVEAASMLLAGLSKRGMLASVVADAPAVMVQLARNQSAALILTMAPSSPDLAALLDAVRTYYPHTGCWMYRCEKGEAVGRLIKLDGFSAPGPASPSEPVGGGQLSAPRAQPAEPAPEAERDEPLISQAEMAMLLGHADSELEQAWGG